VVWCSGEASADKTTLAGSYAADRGGGVERWRATMQMQTHRPCCPALVAASHSRAWTESVTLTAGPTIVSQTPQPRPPQAACQEMRARSASTGTSTGAGAARLSASQHRRQLFGSHRCHDSPNHTTCDRRQIVQHDVSLTVAQFNASTRSGYLGAAQIGTTAKVLWCRARRAELECALTQMPHERRRLQGLPSPASAVESGCSWTRWSVGVQMVSVQPGANDESDVRPTSSKLIDVPSYG
jgi:hypothetical protein